MEKSIKIGGHRGYCLTPEEDNTLCAMQRALDAGMDYVEIDLQYTKDDVIVITHDDVIQHEGKDYLVVDLTYQEITAMHKDIPTLDMVVEQFKDTELGFLLELKPCTDKLGKRMEPYLFSLMKSLEGISRDRVCVFSIDYTALWLLNAMDADGKILKGIIATEHMGDPVAFMRHHRVDLYLAYLHKMDEELVTKLKSAGYQVSGSVVNTLEDKQRALQLGVDMFETDCYTVVK